jgi:hypothetical protein
MTLRSRHKRLRGNEEDNLSITEEPQEDLTYNPDAANSNGASYIRYEIIEKKGKQFVVPVRYSIRRLRQAPTNTSQEDQLKLERHILQNDTDLEY